MTKEGPVISTPTQEGRVVTEEITDDFKYGRGERYNPVELIKQFWPNASTSHITFDPTLRWSDAEYSVNNIEGSYHDGTSMGWYRNLN